MADGASQEGPEPGLPSRVGVWQGWQVERLMDVRRQTHRVAERLQSLRAEVEKVELELMRLDGEEGELVITLGAVDPSFKSWCPPLTAAEAEAYRELYAEVEGSPGTR